jgi:sortase A
MPLMEKQRRVPETKRPNYAVFRRRRRIGFIVFVLLAMLAVAGLRVYLSMGTSEETNEAPSEQVDTPVVEQEEASQETADEEEKAAEEEEAERAVAAPEDPTLYLTVPRLGVYSHRVLNDNSEWALDLGAIKIPESGFPWEKEDTNTYMACHRIGWPGTESYNQCLNLPLMQKGDEVFLQDTNGTVYKYQVSEVFAIRPFDVWVANPLPGRDVVSLQTCTENPNDWWTLGPGLFGGGPESGRLVVRADRVT